MTFQTDKWTYPEFHAFVMLYAANSDGRITLDEENLIAPTITMEEYKRIKSIFMACDDADALDSVFSKVQNYQEEVVKRKIVANMQESCGANPDFGEMKRSLAHFSERIFKCWDLR